MAGDRIMQAFWIGMRRAPDVPLGLTVELRGDTELLITEVLPGGAVEAWNRLCLPGSSREIKAGDRIIMVNGEANADEMVLEIRQKLFLRMLFFRPVRAICGPVVPLPQTRLCREGGSSMQG